LQLTIFEEGIPVLRSLCLALLLFLPVSGAHAALITQTFSGDGLKDAFLVPGTEQAIGEARYGNNSAAGGDWELGVGIDTQAVGMFSQADRAWTSGAVESFSLSYDDSTDILTFAVGATSVAHNVGTITVDDLFLRVATSMGAGNSVALTNLDLGGTALPDLSASNSNTAEWMVVFGAGTTASFTLTGDVEFNFASNTSGSRPAFQVKLGQAVPEPGTGLLLGLGCLMLAGRRRLRAARRT
jgi:hypothetical protein